MKLLVRDGTEGTPEQAWISCGRLASVRRLAMQPGVRHAGGRVVVVAPHPDDETLALGGTLFTLARSGRAVTMVAVTDGEGSHPRSRTTSPRELAARRARERSIAMAHLGLETADVVRLGIEDGHVRRSPLLIDRLVELVRGASVCFAPWRFDGHPDHDAAGHAAADACARVAVLLLEYPVWAWHWARPGSRDLPWHRARRLPLDSAARHAKGRAVAAYASQVRPLSATPGDEAIVPPPVLSHFRRSFELVFQ